MKLGTFITRGTKAETLAAAAARIDSSFLGYRSAMRAFDPDSDSALLPGRLEGDGFLFTISPRLTNGLKLIVRCRVEDRGDGTCSLDARLSVNALWVFALAIVSILLPALSALMLAAKASGPTGLVNAAPPSNGLVATALSLLAITALWWAVTVFCARHYGAKARRFLVRLLKAAPAIEASP